jgi:hypothetical protein
VAIVDLEAWRTGLVINTRSRELASVERCSTRPATPNLGFSHRFGYTLKWHDGSSTTSFLRHTLAPGEQRPESTEWRIKQAVYVATKKCGGCGQMAQVIGGKAATHQQGKPGSGICPGSGASA